MSDSKGLLIGAIVVLIIALGLLAGGIAYTVNMTNKTKDYVKVDSTVVDIVEVRVSDDDGGMKTLYSEIVEYVVDGKTYSAKNTSASNMPKKKGEKITISYNPSNPSEYVFQENTVMLAAILFVMGAVFGIVGIVLIRFSIKLKI